MSRIIAGRQADGRCTIRRDERLQHIRRGVSAIRDSGLCGWNLRAITPQHGIGIQIRLRRRIQRGKHPIGTGCGEGERPIILHDRADRLSGKSGEGDRRIGYGGQRSGGTAGGISGRVPPRPGCASRAGRAGNALYALSAGCACRAGYAGNALYALSAGNAGNALYALRTGCAGRACRAGCGPCAPRGPCAALRSLRALRPCPRPECPAGPIRTDGSLRAGWAGRRERARATAAATARVASTAAEASAGVSASEDRDRDRGLAR